LANIAYSGLSLKKNRSKHQSYFISDFCPYVDKLSFSPKNTSVKVNNYWIKNMSRIFSVDTFRLIAIIAVICIHTSPFENFNSPGTYFYELLAIFIDQTSRFAVPFFFAISGYFWSSKIKKGHSPISSAHHLSKRVLGIFIFWSVAYLLPYNISSIAEFGYLGPIKVAYWHGLHILNNPTSLLIQGTKFHLWFLPSLIFSTYFCALFIQLGLNKTLLTLAVILYILGTLTTAYSETPIGVFIGFDTVKTPMLGILLFYSGYYLNTLKTTIKWLHYGMLIFMLGWLIHFGEIFTLWKVYNIAPHYDYVFGTYLMGLGITIAAVSNHPAFTKNNFNTYGYLTLGIYASHLIFIEQLEYINKTLHTPLWEVSYVIIVFIFSVIFTKVLSHIKWIKNFVT